MSASLVGSEMCIRDSCARARRGAKSGVPAHAAPATTRPRGAPPRRGPVSYTHLTLPTICSV
eukprot:12945325-Alexandrium_andersonii.AAC.1